MKKLKPIPKDNKGLPNLPKSVRNNMGLMSYGGKTKRKSYAYGSMVRTPMNPDTSMKSTMNPMMPREQRGMMSAPTPMSDKMNK